MKTTTAADKAKKAKTAKAKSQKSYTPKPDIYAMVTEQILEQLAKGVAPWHKPWSTIKPFNFHSKKEYRGVNPMLLSGARDPRFLTYNQAIELGGNVKKGAKSYIVVFWAPLKTKLVEVEDEETGEKQMMIDGKSFGKFVLKYYRVFCATDIEGIEFPPLVENNVVFNPIESAEQVWEDYKNRPSLDHGGNRAFYRSSTDYIQMPHKEAFGSPGEYYSTLFHEMGHSTGHKNRLSRKGIVEFDGFGSHSYSQEELVAEMTAAFLCAHSGIENTIENSAAYLKSWSKALQDDTKMIIYAAGQAQKAAELILGTIKEIEASEDIGNSDDSAA